MARPKNQQMRRSELVSATQQVIAQFGLDGTRLHRIAKVAGLTPGAVLYYYPEIEDLIITAIRRGIDRFDAKRSDLLERFSSSPDRLRSLISHGLPHSTDDTDVRMFCQLGGAAGESNLAATLLTSLFDSQVSLYRLVLEQGNERREFVLQQEALTIARNLVALEDAYGYRIIAGHPVIDPAEATRLIFTYATLSTGFQFTAEG